jgi:type IV pilus assembly protein PilP
VTPKGMPRVTQAMRSLALIVAAPLVLSACGFSSETEIQQWMAETRSTMKPNTQPVPEPKQFTPQTYESRAVVDPFDGQKIVMAVARQQQVREGVSKVKPDLDRRRETLEGFPLDQVRMVGMMRQSGTNVALVESNGSTHMLRVGNYVGQNFGLVTRITEAEVQLKEIVQDAAGEWVERPAKLELQDAPAATQGRRR